MLSQLQIPWRKPRPLRVKSAYWQVGCLVCDKSNHDIPYSHLSTFAAVGTTESLAGRHPTYEVHFPARTRDEVLKAQQLMAQIPGSRMADDVATRFEVPIQAGTAPPANEQSNLPTTSQSLSLAQLFETLSTQNDFPEYTVERVSLESVFLKVIREHNIQEEETIAQRRKARKGTWRIC